MTDRSRVNPNSTQFIPLLLWIYNIGNPSFFLLFRELQDSPDPEIRGKCQLFQENPFFGAAVLSLYGRQTHLPHMWEMFSFFFKLSRSWNPKAHAGPWFSLNVGARLFRSFYRMSDPRPVSCLLRSGTKRCSGEEIVFFFHQTSPPSSPTHQPCEKARTRRLPSSSSRRHSGIRLIQCGRKPFPLLLSACPSTWLLLSISWSISDSCYIWAERRQFILARPVHI